MKRSSFYFLCSLNVRTVFKLYPYEPCLVYRNTYVQLKDGDSLMTQTEFRTINGNRVPFTREIEPEPEPEPAQKSDGLSLLLYVFIGSSVVTAIVRSLIMIDNQAAAIASVLFVLTGEWNMIYLKNKIGSWNSIKQENTAMFVVVILFITTAINVSCFLIEMFNVKWLIEFERLWFIMIQPLIAAASILGSLFISRFLDPASMLAVMDRDQSAQDKIQHIFAIRAAKKTESDREAFARANAELIRQRKQAAFLEMVANGELDTYIQEAAKLGAFDTMNYVVHGSITQQTNDEPQPKPEEPQPKVIISTGDHIENEFIGDQFVITASRNEGLGIETKGDRIEIIRQMVAEKKNNREIGEVIGITQQHVGRLRRTYNIN